MINVSPNLHLPAWLLVRRTWKGKNIILCLFLCTMSAKSKEATLGIPDFCFHNAGIRYLSSRQK